MSENENEIQEIQEGGNTRTPSLVRTVSKQRRTKQISPAKKWLFVLNNWTKDDTDKISNEAHTEVPLLIFQSEIGENGTKHLQGYLEFKFKKRPKDFYSIILGHNRTHWEKAKGTRDQNVAYCSKNDTYDGDIRYQRGLPEKLVLMERTDMRADQLAIADKYKLAEDPKFGRQIHWYWEAKGGWGKSILTIYMVDQMGAILLGGANKDALYGIAAYVHKHEQGPPIVIFDIPRINRGKLSYQSLEYIKNGCFFNGKYESSMVRYNKPHILVFANCEPDYESLSPDRWDVTQLDPPIVEIQPENDPGLREQIDEIDLQEEDEYFDDGLASEPDDEATDETWKEKAKTKEHYD